MFDGLLAFTFGTTLAAAALVVWIFEAEGQGFEPWRRLHA